MSEIKNNADAQINDEVNANETATADTSDNAKQGEKQERKDKKASKKLEAQLKELTDKNAALEASLAEEKDRALRIMAEYENFRRRTKAERESVYADAYIDAIKEILPIMDNLDRAEGFDNAEDVKTGLVMIMKGAREALKKMGVEEIEALGLEFDPNLHNAVMHTEDESLGENTVSAVLQKGYKKGDKIIRYAMVQVAN